MARVDPDDDSIRRFVIYRYAYDPVRRERRHQLVAAYDDVAEFERELDLRRRPADRHSTGASTGAER